MFRTSPKISGRFPRAIRKFPRIELSLFCSWRHLRKIRFLAKLIRRDLGIVKKEVLKMLCCVATGESHALYGRCR